jgi:redox-sensing transcriptional repressor
LEDKEISRAVIGRLPRYFRYLGELKDSGVERISSQELSERMKVTASQIRQDFNNFGGFGQQGYGYNVKYLYEEIGKILGLGRKHNLILVGAGNLGQALAGYVNFEKRGFMIRGIFDNNEELIDQTIRGIPIMKMSLMEQFVIENQIDIAVIAIPKSAAIGVAEQLCKCGIKAIWNFSHVDLNVPKNIVVENVHLSESLMRLSYNINCYEQEHKSYGKREREV